MKIIIKIFLLLLPVLANAQSPYLEKLHLRLAEAPNDTIRMDLNDLIGLHYAEINHDSTLLYRNIAIEYARKLNLKIDEADVLTGKGYIFLKMQITQITVQTIYDIIKAHGGEIKVESKIEEGSKFIIQLPLA